MGKIRDIVNSHGYSTVMEPFGGSGIITVNLYNDGVIDYGYVNDYDNFFDGFRRALDYKDLIVKDCSAAGMVPQKCKIIDGKHFEYIEKDGKTIYRRRHALPDKYRKVLRDSVLRHVPECDYKLLANFNNFTYPMKGTFSEIRLSDFSYYRRTADTSRHREYLKVLDNITVDHLDYKEFLKKYPPRGDTLLIIDPPYINKKDGFYKNSFSAEETKELIDVVADCHCDFVFFNSSQEIVESLLSNFDDPQYFTVTTGGQNIDYAAYVRV